MKNEKTRGERGAFSHYILVIVVVSYSVVLYMWHCVFRIALAFHVIDVTILYTAARKMTPAIALLPSPSRHLA